MRRWWQDAHCFSDWWLLELPLPHMANTAFYIFTLTAGYLAC